MPTGQAHTLRRIPPSAEARPKTLPTISRQVISWPPIVQLRVVQPVEDAHAVLLRRGVGGMGEQSLDVLGDDVDLEVDRVAGLLAAQRGELERGGIRLTVNDVVVDATATVSETPSTVIEPLSHDVAGEVARQRDAHDLPVLATARARSDRAGAVDVALHEVTAEPAVAAASAARG